jgi:hypothetical protein
MTSRPPTRRLVDVLKQNSKQILEKHATDLAASAASLHAEAIQTRFLRNQFLIHPKSLQLLADESMLTRWHVFGVYKPPFCPMRKSDAHDNYHHVSVESFVESALRSKVVYPILRRVLAPSELQVRVLYNLDTFASGPVLVALSNYFEFATSLATTAMEYDVLVSGHLPVHATGNHTKIDVAHLFPSTPGTRPSATLADPTTQRRLYKDGDTPSVSSPSPFEAFYEVKENGYYSVHPVSLLNVVVKAPPTPHPPALQRFAREKLGTCIVGDPLVMGELMQLREYTEAPTPSQSGIDTKNDIHNTRKKGAGAERGGRVVAASGDAAAHEAAVKLAANPHIVSMRGDCDFPRVFEHLRELRVDTRNEQSRCPPSLDTTSAHEFRGNCSSGSSMMFQLPLGKMASDAQQQQRQRQDAFAQNVGIELHCRKCFHGLVRRQLTSSFKSRRIGLLDGTWTPQAEFL